MVKNIFHIIPNSPLLEDKDTQYYFIQDDKVLWHGTNEDIRKDVHVNEEGRLVVQLEVDPFFPVIVRGRGMYIATCSETTITLQPNIVKNVGYLMAHYEN